MKTQWPPLPLAAWRDTLETLHRHAQVVGKIQLALTPVVNHFWNVTLRVSARGLADFYRDLMSALSSLGIAVSIWDLPVELKTEAIPLSQDRVHASYDRDAVRRFFRVLASAHHVLEEFRSRFVGKSSDVGFYWGTFDLAVARYCGRRAPGPLPSGVIEREAYSHEVSEVGFWPGDAVYRAPAFYALHYPAPEGYSTANVRPAGACWQEASHCFVLPYDACREHDTRAQVLDFFQSTYEVGANLARWDRAELERTPQGAVDAR